MVNRFIFAEPAIFFKNRLMYKWRQSTATCGK